MSLLSVNTEVCQRDGVCSNTCPLGIISLDKDSSLPFMTTENSALCISCGHCVAICPHKALSHTHCPAEKCETLNSNWHLTPEAMAQFLKGRRSVRRYTATPIAKETLEQIIDVARYAPTGHNQQNMNWLVVYNPEQTRALAQAIANWMREFVEHQPAMAQAAGIPPFLQGFEQGKDTILRGSPHVVITYGQTDNPIARMACTSALAYFELAALAHGLGTCWAGFAMMAMSSPLVQKLLEIPEGQQGFAAMMVGQPRFRYQRIPQRRQPIIEWRE